MDFKDYIIYAQYDNGKFLGPGVIFLCEYICDSLDISLEFSRFLRRIDVQKFKDFVEECDKNDAFETFEDSDDFDVYVGSDDVFFQSKKIESCDFYMDIDDMLDFLEVYLKEKEIYKEDKTLSIKEKSENIFNRIDYEHKEYLSYIFPLLKENYFIMFNYIYYKEDDCEVAIHLFEYPNKEHGYLVYQGISCYDNADSFRGVAPQKELPENDDFFVSVKTINFFYNLVDSLFMHKGDDVYNKLKEYYIEFVNYISNKRYAKFFDYKYWETNYKILSGETTILVTERSQ